jgi:hypothetical protein
MRSSDPQSEALGRFTGFSAQSVRDALAILVAALIELGSGLDLWVAAGGTTHSEPKEESRASAVKAAPVALPVELPETAEAEAAGQPSPPRPRRKRTAKPRKALGVAGQGAKVIQFRKSPSPEDIRSMLVSGRTQKEVAAIFGMSDRTLRRKLSASASGQMSAFAPGQMSASMAAS